MSDEPESLMLKILREMRAELGEVHAELGEVRADVAALKANGVTKGELASELRSLRADVASDMLTQRKEIGEQIAGLRRAVIDYHTSVIGHGVLISDLEQRVRRVERHLNLPPLRATRAGAGHVAALASASARRFSTNFTASTEPS